MSRPISQERTKVFWPNVGGIAQYQQNLTAILSYVNQYNPTRGDVIAWIRQTYGVVHEFARKLLNVLRAAGVLRCEDSKYGSAQEFVKGRILGCLPEGHEFSLGGCHSLGFQQQVAQVLVAPATPL
jgi:hypothetical protein